MNKKVLTESVNGVKHELSIFAKVPTAYLQFAGFRNGKLLGLRWWNGT